MSSQPLNLGTLPAAPGGKKNVVFQADAPNVDPTVVRNVSAYVDTPPVTMTATVGGLVPTPPNDATKFLAGDGTFKVPAGGGGAGFRQIQLDFHDDDILNMQQDSSGGLVLLNAVPNKFFVPLTCLVKFHYGGTAFFAGTAFDDLFLYVGSQNFIMSGSTRFLLDGGQGNNFMELLHHGFQPTAVLGSGDNGLWASGQNIWLATTDTPLTGGDPGVNSNTLTVTLAYLEYDFPSAILS